MNNSNITRLSESEQNSNKIQSKDDDSYLVVARLEWDKNLKK